MLESGGTLGSTRPLSVYVGQYLANTGDSERSLAARSKDPETGLPVLHGWINTLVNGQMSRAPEMWRLRALAAGMGVPPRVLARLAAAQWLEVEVTEHALTDDASVIVSVPGDLTEEERRKLIRMAEGLAREFRE
jgi:hypothetical protein